MHEKLTFLQSEAVKEWEYLSPDLLVSVKEAGTLALDVRDKGLIAHEKLSKEDLVTQGDTEVSQHLQKSLQSLFENISFLDEESAETHGMNVSDEEFVAVIDPIDGTGNYYQGLLEQDLSKRNPNWGVSVGLVRRGEIVAGIIYQPQNDSLFYAEKGRGGYRNGERLTVSQTRNIQKNSLIYSIPYTHDKKENEATKRTIENLVSTYDIEPEVLGSQVIETMQVATGKKDVFMMYKTKPWDIAAAVAINTEAGGKVYKGDGQQYSLFDESILLTNGVVDVAPLTEAYLKELIKA